MSLSIDRKSSPIHDILRLLSTWHIQHLCLVTNKAERIFMFVNHLYCMYWSPCWWHFSFAFGPGVFCMHWGHFQYGPYSFSPLIYLHKTSCTMEGSKKIEGFLLLFLTLIGMFLRISLISLIFESYILLNWRCALPA